MSFPPRRLVTIYPKVDHFLPQEGKKKISRFSEFESNVSIIVWILLIKCDVICINFVHFFLFIFAFIFWFYRMKRVDYEFLIDKVHTRLASWKNKLLNKAGRLILAKSVLNVIPTYYMQISWLPQSICNQLNKMTRKFIWKGIVSKGVHLVGWDKITCPKSFGGLVSEWLALLTLLSLESWCGIFIQMLTKYGCKFCPTSILTILVFWIFLRRMALPLGTQFWRRGRSWKMVLFFD